MILGYSQSEDGSWEPIEEAKRGYVYTQAFILCKNCRGTIRSIGGPRYNSLCLGCYDEMSRVRERS